MPAAPQRSPLFSGAFGKGKPSGVPEYDRLRQICLWRAHLEEEMDAESVDTFNTWRDTWCEMIWNGGGAILPCAMRLMSCFVKGPCV